MSQTQDKARGAAILQALRSATARLDAARPTESSADLSHRLERIGAELDTLRALLEIIESQLETERCSRPVQRTLADIERRIGLAAEEVRAVGT